LQGADRTSTFCGTADYLAPEILQSQPYGKVVDWWSLGCVIYEMLVGVSPFYNPNMKRMYRAILNDDVRFPAGMSPTARDFIFQLLKKNPDQRLGHGPEGQKEIQAHPFFATINWHAVFERRVRALWQPVIRSPLDVSHFAKEFTTEDPTVSYTPPSSSTAITPSSDGTTSPLPRMTACSAKKMRTKKKMTNKLHINLLGHVGAL
jgi:serine/threonine protein kinase